MEIFPNRRENFDDYRILYGECTVFGVGGDAPTVPRTAVVDLRYSLYKQGFQCYFRLIPNPRSGSHNYKH